MCAKTTKPTRSIVYLSNSRQGKRVAQEIVVAVDCVWCVFFSITFWLFQLETRERGEFTAKEMCLSKAQNWVDKYRFCCLIEGDNEYKSVITSVGPWLTKSKTSSSPSSLWYINTKKQREREGLAAPLRCCYKSHATPKKMGRTSKVAKTHKSPFSFSSRSKKHFLRFSNRKKKGNARRQGDSIQHPDGFHIVETRDSFAAPFARQVMCWERGKIFRKSPTGEQTDRNLCVCAAARITLHLQLWCISREFRLSLQFRMVSKKANEKKKKKERWSLPIWLAYRGGRKCYQLLLV